ncbi:uncharacterized protein [Zea mays]|uniref:uncharacterized protein n=1 Tax=Zea mays TaxID=4577 RepID=UPI001652C128|nr:uncharacterized protein LOC103637876 [Zea mays]
MNALVCVTALLTTGQSLLSVVYLCGNLGPECIIYAMLLFHRLLMFDPVNQVCHQEQEFNSAFCCILDGLFRSPAQAEASSASLSSSTSTTRDLRSSLLPISNIVLHQLEGKSNKELE